MFCIVFSFVFLFFLIQHNEVDKFTDYNCRDLCSFKEQDINVPELCSIRAARKSKLRKRYLLHFGTYILLREPRLLEEEPYVICYNKVTKTAERRDDDSH